MPDSIFHVVYSNNVEELKKQLQGDPNLLHIRCTVLHPTAHEIVKVVSWSLLIGKKAATLFLGFAAIFGPVLPAAGGAAAAGATTAGTVGAAEMGASTVMLGVAKKTWEFGDKELRFFRADGEDWTLLHFAAFGNAVEAALYLIKQGIDVTARDAKGRTFQDLACNQQFINLCQGAIESRTELLTVTNSYQQAKNEKARLNEALAVAQQNFQDLTRRLAELNTLLEKGETDLKQNQGKNKELADQLTQQRKMAENLNAELEKSREERQRLLTRAAQINAQLARVEQRISFFQRQQSSDNHSVEIEDVTEEDEKNFRG